MDADGECGWVAVVADGRWCLWMGGGVCGWAVVVADGADACKEKTKQNKKIKRRKNLLVDLECRWMWSEHGGTVDDSARLQVCLDLEIFVRVYAATIYY